MSNNKFLLALSEVGSPGLAKVKEALFNAASCIEDPLSLIVIIPPIPECKEH